VLVTRKRRFGTTNSTKFSTMAEEHGTGLESIEQFTKKSRNAASVNSRKRCSTYISTPIAIIIIIIIIIIIFIIIIFNC
jgi:t-SNARE complex subunit (syntaxin)